MEAVAEAMDGTTKEAMVAKVAGEGGIWHVLRLASQREEVLLETAVKTGLSVLPTIFDATVAQEGQTREAEVEDRRKRTPVAWSPIQGRAAQVSLLSVFVKYNDASRLRTTHFLSNLI